jgi:hypothetical protein
VKFHHLRRAIVLAAIAGGVAGPVVAALPTAQAAQPAAQAARAAVQHRVVLVNCLGHAVVRPKSVVLACADGADFLNHLTWAFWNSQANGAGKDNINSCNPSCVAGHFHSYPVRVQLWRVRNRPHHSGQRYFTRMTLTYTRHIPKGLHRTRVIKLLPTGP